MSVFSFFSPNHPPRKAPNSPRRKTNNPLHVETLEDRSLPSTVTASGVTISGYVFNDLNNSGIYQAGDPPIANNPIELKNAQGTVVANTTTNAAGYYQFNSDATVSQTPLTETKTVTFNATPTDFSLQGLLDQFNPSLGTLQEIDITHAGSITSDIKAENTSTSSGSVITGTVSGNMTLTAPGVNDKLSISQYAGSFNAAAFDGQIDFQGPSGDDFGQKTANGSDNIVLTGSQLTPYIGTGQVQVTEAAQATSNATGGGNIVVNAVSTGQATITVTYKYIPSNSLQPGNYTIVETQEPPGYYPGKNSSNGVVLNNPPGIEVIPVTVTNGNAPGNDFGKLKGSSLAGTVYYDANDDGSFDSGDQGLSGVTVTLSGTTAGGTAVNQTATTDSNGNYTFTGLQQGTYTVTETPPSGYLDGAVTVGTAGGTQGTEQVDNIQLNQGVNATNYNFGELKGGSLAGFVYLDANNDGVMDTGDSGIGNVALTLSGTDDHGNPVSAQATSNSTGAYSFNGLRPGNYTITETPPSGYIDGTDNPGSLGGTAGHDVISAIQLGMGQAGTQYNFGERLQPNADVGIVKTASAPVSSYGSQLTYTLAVTDYGPQTAQGVTVTDTLPSGETFVSASGPGWTVSNTGNNVTATMPSLAVGTTSDITIVVTVPSYNTTLTNTAVVTSQTPDNNPSNNQSTVTTSVQGPPGNPTPQSGPPLNIQGIILSKNQLMGDPGTPFVSAQTLGNMALVEGVYQSLTGSNPNVATLLGGVEQLNEGKLTAQDVVSAAWNSPAHFASVANQLYNQYLGRNPTASESDAVVQALQSGATIQSQAAAILTSPQYQALHPSSADLAFSLYQDITGSTPDGVTQESLAQSMGVETLGQFVSSLQTSSAAVTSTITQVYLDTVRRDPTAAELAQYSPQLQAGTLTADQLAQNLLASQEFYQLAYHAMKP